MTRKKTTQAWCCNLTLHEKGREYEVNMRDAGYMLRPCFRAMRRQASSAPLGTTGVLKLDRMHASNTSVRMNEQKSRPNSSIHTRVVAAAVKRLCGNGL